MVNAGESKAHILIAIIYQINEALKLPFNLDGHELFITVSTGISLFPDDGIDEHTLLKNVGSALYRAREQGGNNYQFYTADMNALIKRCETGFMRKSPTQY